MEEIIVFVITLVSSLIYVNFFNKIHKEQLKLERQEQLKLERLERKLNREDWILHDLTACREDFKEE